MARKIEVQKEPVNRVARVLVTWEEIVALAALRRKTNGGRVIHSKLLASLGITDEQLRDEDGERVGRIHLLRRGASGSVKCTILSTTMGDVPKWNAVDKGGWYGSVTAHRLDLEAFERLTAEG